MSKNGTNKVNFRGNLIKSGDAEKVNIGFQYREFAGFVEELYSDEWQETKTIEVNKSGEFSLNSTLKKSGKTYQIRAFVDHPKLRIYGDVVRIKF